MKLICVCVAIIVALLSFSSDARTRRSRLAETDSDIVLLKRVVPAFPLDAFASCTAGYALVEFTVDEQGDVVDASAVESQPEGVFASAAVAAVSQWKFSPRIVSGAAVSQRVSQKIDFTISSECVLNAELPDDDGAAFVFDEQAARDDCRQQSGGEFGLAELDFRVDESGRADGVTVVRSTSGRFAHLAREQLAERSFDSKYEALTFSHVFAFCMTGS